MSALSGISDFFGGVLVFLEVLLVFNVIIVAHETGHFLAAKWRGLRIEKFGVWFGPPLCKWRRGGVEYILGTIPAGGYVALPQMANPEMLEGASAPDNGEGGGDAISPLDKILVAAAGPAASMLCAFLFATVVWVVGKPVSESEFTTVVGYVEPGSGAAKAGILPGDRILSINGREIKKFGGMTGLKNTVSWNIAKRTEPEVSVVVLRNGAEREMKVDAAVPEKAGYGRKALPQIGISAAATLVVGKVYPGSPAEEAGLASGDIVEAVGGEKIYSGRRAGEIVRDSKGKPLRVTIRRGEETFDVSIAPRVAQGRPEPLLGVAWDLEARTRIEHPDPVSQVRESLATMLETLKAIATPKSDIGAQHLSGPVGIMRLYYLLFEAPDGWRIALWFSVIFNVNLAILNLLPVPVLDGGHILLAIVERVRGRRMAARLSAALQTGFAIVIFGFLIYVTGYDVLDYLDDKLGARGGEIPSEPSFVR